MQTITGLTQGADFKLQLTPPESWNLTFRPGSDHAVLKLRELKELVRDDETQLSFTGSTVVATLTDRSGDIVIYPDRLELVISGKKNKGWKLPALEEKILRALDTATPPNVTLTYPSQLLHGTLVVSDAAGKTIANLELEFRMKTSPAYG